MSLLPVILLVIVASSVADADGVAGSSEYCDKLIGDLENPEAAGRYTAAEEACKGEADACQKSICINKKLNLMDNEGYMIPDSYANFMLPEVGFDDFKTAYSINLAACKNAEMIDPDSDDMKCVGMMKFVSSTLCTNSIIMEECGFNDMPIDLD